jgi:signal transduction histidine kinase
VGSTLSSISVFSKVAQVETEKGNTAKANELLDKVRDTSAKMINEMNDIVWAINPGNDTMEKIIQRMESFARPLLAARNMQFHFNYDPMVKSLNLEMEQRKNFFLIFKEAVNNAIKYSGGNLLEATINYQQGLLELNVKDNGVGFNKEKEMNNKTSLSGNGLKNMESRAKDMNANLSIESSPGNGTFIRLLCPFV